MADDEANTARVVPTIESINEIGARLSEHADSITNAARRDIASDLRLAARIATAYASLRFGVAEVADKLKATDPATADLLVDLLTEEM